MGGVDPNDARPRPPAASTARQTWLALRACAAVLLGFALVLYGFHHKNGLACLVGCVLMLMGLLLTYSKGSRMQHRFGAGDS